MANDTACTVLIIACTQCLVKTPRERERESPGVDNYTSYWYALSDALIISQVKKDFEKM